MRDRPPAHAGSIAGALGWATALLDGDNPRLEAAVLLGHCLGRPRSHLLAWPDKPLDESVRRCFEALVARRRQGEPVAYLTGRREFWSLDLVVTPATLIPRPETETLVERALARLPEETPLRVADLGTGSGAVALALARERPHATIVATDISETALAVAAHNRRGLASDNVSLVRTDWCRGLRGLQLVVTNPPYVACGDPHLRRGDVRFEPAAALASGAEGLDDIRRIVGDLPACMNAGWLLTEHGHTQGPAVRRLMQEAGLAAVASHPDLAGRERVTEGWWSGEGGLIPPRNG
ncbi:MAG: peptide chain release factor N(5)-glutamine methyltransferase [Gammaproteobacteria bacterium]|nr:peptide chain release factor N(5)-glutamine methyltransferase [Gammaproteobacteria bacterium]